MRFIRRACDVDAVQWQPDPEFGEWKRGRLTPYYRNRKIGIDASGVQYTVLDTVLPTAGRTDGWPISPGDWIVTYENGTKAVFSDAHFREQFVEAETDAEEPAEIQGAADQSGR